MTLPERSPGIAAAIGAIDPAGGAAALEVGLKALLPGQSFRWALTRGNWHRLGGLVDAQGQPIHGNIARWAEEAAGGDLAALTARYGDKGYRVTRLAGKTLYFTATSGEGPEAFLQLEIEELQPVLDRPLFPADWLPDSLEELIDPAEAPRLDPLPVGRPYYLFRRLTDAADLVRGASLANRAFEGEPFCRHWVLGLREGMDGDGERRLLARPISTFAGEAPPLPTGDLLHGAELANAIHGYDRRLGYPFAWYFDLVSRKGAHFTLAESVLRDQMGAYDYLPARDLKVLRRWEERPYAV